jgi:hypothetical protein
MKEKILAVLEMGLKDDGKSFYTNEEKAEMIAKIVVEIGAKAYDDAIYACNNGVGYDNGLEYVKAIL